MFKTIRWRFVFIYFILVLVALIIIGVFMSGRLEATQLDNLEEDIDNTVTAMVSAGDLFSDPNWQANIDNFQEVLERWQISPNYQLYTIYDPDAPKIIAAVNANKDLSIENAYSYGNLELDMIARGFGDNNSRRVIKNTKEDISQMHLTYPILDTDGDTNGIIYVIADLTSIDELLGDFSNIFISAIGISFVITVILGLFLAGTITGPIDELTKKVEILAEGHYDQKVEIRSDDEIGKLAQTFNFLTSELNKTITDMEIERGKLDTIFEYMQEGVVAIDRSSRLIHANQAGVEILGIKREDKDQVINLAKLNIYGIDYSKADSLEGESSLEVSGRYFNILYGPYLDKKDYPSGIIVVFQDVTKERKLDESRKDFVANVSHELKTPLTTIKTYTETILANKDLDSDTKYHFMSVVGSEVDRMSNLVQDLLQLSNIDYEDSKLDIDKINLSDFMDSMILSLDSLREERNIDLEYINETKNLVISSERSSLEKIVLNILSNAYKYSDPGSKVKVLVSQAQDQFEISVEDEGIGIPYADQKHIFDRFYRVEKGRSRQAGGTGLGLAIAKELVEVLGGDIKLSSRPQVGTRIRIILPKKLEV